MCEALVGGADPRFRRFEAERKLAGCADRRQLPFDGWVHFVDSDGSCWSLLIEYDGEQHFEFHSHFHRTRKAFEMQQRRDRIKDAFVRASRECYLIRLAYDVPEADTEAVLAAEIAAWAARPRGGLVRYVSPGELYGPSIRFE